MKLLFTFILIFSFFTPKSQLLNWSPQFANETSDIVITVDATAGNKGLMGHIGNVYMHLGVITNTSGTPSDWKYVKGEWGTTNAPVATPAGTNKWTITINNIRNYFGVPAGETILKLVMVFRDAAGNRVQRNSDGSDMYIPIYSPGFNGIQFTDPYLRPTYNITRENISATVNVPVSVTATASATSGTTNLYFDGIKIAGPVTGSNTINGSGTPAIKGYHEFVAEYITGAASYYDTVSFYIAADNNIVALPAGVKEGINYGADCSTATLVLYAPNKNNVVVVGDFPGSNWAPKTAFQMNKTPDGSYYWLTVSGLTAGTEYAFNYRVDDTIYVADPYSEKVLDPYNDQYISTATYPNLKPYPVNANVSPTKNGIVTVLQTCQPVYNWQTTTFTKPDKRNLITYELLVRDFGDQHTYQMLIDTISYFKRLGVNAIELMPVNEFSGNDSWGYNPTYYCALDKYYGPKNTLKQFVDLCHQNGIAVILDVVFNQMEAGQAPQGKLYWDVAKNRPAANNPWLNIAAPHPYFPYQYDLNHESAATKYLIQRTFEYWLSEYKVDGFRVDAGKGFTQKCTQVNDMCPVATGSIEDYDASRVAILNSYYDFVQSKFPDTYMILEFLGQQRQEEQEYANHGFMLWGNNNPAYNQATMGYKDNSNFSKIVYNSNDQAFSTPAEMGYMESHDEERLMFKNLAYGNSSGAYNVKNLATALERQAAAAALFFTVPGPKMIWQFGERGYDISIEEHGGRVSAKPPHWEYMQDPNRLKLWDAYSKLIRLRLQNPDVFNSTNFSYDFYDNNGLFKRFQIADPNSAGLKVTVVANFDVVPQTRTVTFQSTGNWYSFLSNGTGAGLNGATGTSIFLSGVTQSITLQPGEYHVYLDRAVVLPLKLLSFSALKNSSAVNIKWVTEKEVNVREYQLQRATDGNIYNTIHTTASTNSLINQKVYSYSDVDPVIVNSKNKLYYRLKMVDLDGQYSYSNVAVITPGNGKSQINLYPNPVKGTVVYLQVPGIQPSMVQLKIEDVNGRLYKTLSTNLSTAPLPLDIGNLPGGVYILKFRLGNTTYTKQFNVQ